MVGDRGEKVKAVGDDQHIATGTKLYSGCTLQREYMVLIQ